MIKAGTIIAASGRRFAMGQYRQLLVLLTEVDRHSAALRRALALVQVSGAAVHVLGLFEPVEEHTLQEERLNEEQILRQYSQFREQLAQMLERQRPSAIRLTFETVKSDDIRGQAIDYIAEFAPDMVIKDGDAVPALARLFNTPLDCALMRGVRGLTHFVPRSAPGLPKHVMVAVDTSLHDSEALQDIFNKELIKVAQALALQCDAQLHLLSAYDLTGVFVADVNVAQAWVEELRETLQEPFETLADSQGVPPNRRYFVGGSPVQVIGEQVRALDIDVVVMGVVQPKGLDKLLGDTTERIVSTLPCSVLAVHPDLVLTWEPTSCS
nr:universal stress protein [Pseudomonas sp. RC2C2]